MLTQEQVRRWFDYNPNTGILSRKRRPRSDFTVLNAQSKWNNQVNKPCNSIDTKGYLTIYISGKHYRLHNIIWLWQVGKWPTYEIDHIDRVKHNNSWDNLRDVTTSVNARNKSTRKDNTSGVAGVSYDKRNNHWVAFITIETKRVYLGCFKLKETAIIARKIAEKDYNYAV